MGYKILSFEDDKEGGRGRKPQPGDAAASQRQRKRLPATDVGNALKSAYDRTLHEDIPPEMLDLLGKLG